MATKKEIEQHLKLALKEIGEIVPWYDEEVSAWVFEHPLYPVGYANATPEAVIANYPLHLKEFISERLNNNLNPLVEKETKGHGGARIGAGRPIGTTKTPTKQIRVPTDIADWLKIPQNIETIRRIKNAPLPQLGAVTQLTIPESQKHKGKRC
jgi:hypothetical protein